MVGRKISSTIAVFAIVGLSTPTLAADGASGMASNRMALAMPVAPEGATPCTPNTANDGGPCNPVTGGGFSWPSIRFLLAGLAAAGAVAATAAGVSSGGHNSSGGGTSPVSP
jgi:hypothetical protein